MRFAVAAGNPKSGEQRVLVVEAYDAAAAEQIVLGRGWAVSSIWIASPDDEPAVPEASVLSALENEAFVNAGRAGTCAWFAIAVMLLIGLALLPDLVRRLDRMELAIIVLIYITLAAFLAFAAHHVRRLRMWSMVVLPALATLLAIIHAFPILAMLMDEVYEPLLILFLLCVLLFVAITIQCAYALTILNRIRRRGALGFEVQSPRSVGSGQHNN